MRRRTPLLRDLQWRGYVNQILPREPIYVYLTIIALPRVGAATLP